MEVTFQKNVRLSVVDLILVGISVPDFSLKMSQKRTNNKDVLILNVQF